MMAEAKHYREQLIEKVSEADDQHPREVPRSGEEITEDEIKAALRKRVNSSVRARPRRGRSCPVICGSAFKNKGVQPMLDAVVDFLPSPLDVPAIVGIDPDKKVDPEHPTRTDRASGVRRRAVQRAGVQDHDRPVRRSAHVLPRLLGRAHGRARSVLNATKGKTERIGRLLKMHANKREEIKEVYAGDIAAAVGLKSVTTGDTLCDEKQADRPRVDGLPRAGHLAGHRAAGPRPTRKSSASASAS